MTEERRIRVLSVDDHPLLSEGIAAIIKTQTDMELVGHAVDGATGLVMYRRHRPDITLLDIRLPDMSGIDLLITLRAEFINARIIMLSTFQGDIEIERALEAGARGFLLKNMPNKELVAAIREVHAGKKCVSAHVAAHLAQYLAEDHLTAREIEVLALISAGKGNRDIADTLFITEDTVKGHVRHIMEKLGAQNRAEAVVIAVRRGIIQI
jgi:DNA-binding NarL/FixJ family response regulator